MLQTFLTRIKGHDACPSRIPFHNIAWSWLGSFVGIYLVSILSRLSRFDMLDNMFLIGSFGASAVLIYGAPHVEYAQPRNLVGGHILSALVGVSLTKYLPVDTALLAALAVSVSIVLMHFTRTLHPPGGATALIAVIGSDEVHRAGYQFVLTPVAIGVIIMLVVALLINNISSNSKRHYPKFW